MDRFDTSRPAIAAVAPQSKKPQTWRPWLLVGVLLCLIATTFQLYQLTTPPTASWSSTTLTITPGSGVRTIAAQLYAEELIRSPLLFTLYVRWQHGDTPRLRAGHYEISEPLPIPQLVDLLSDAQDGIQLVRITLVEGQSVRRFAETLADSLPDFDTTEFIDLAVPLEGSLFPDTYYVPPDYAPSQLVELLSNTYKTRIAEFAVDIEDHALTEYEILILASIIEREANTPESKRFVSGILQNRLSINMPLQADASIEYVLDKPLSELTPSDLEIDSPYNTYLNAGLPPTPINNPGLNSIRAVLEPEETDYLFYITAPDGTFHYAEDFDTHRLNIQRYLRAR